MGGAMAESPGWRARLRALVNSWMLRSIALGGVSTAIDVAVGWSLVTAGAPTRVGAMSGIAVGAIFTFFANRYLAFRDTGPRLAGAGVRYVLVLLVLSTIHGQFVVWFRDGLGVHYVLSKFAADLCVFTFGQPLALRYIVFPRRKDAPAAAPQSPSASGHSQADR